MISPGHVTGFGLLANSAIDQHVDARAREADLDPVVAAHPHLLGIGLYQSAAIIVHADSFFVVSGPVLIHDGQSHGNVRYYKLLPGQVYDLKRRVAPGLRSDQAQQYPLDLTLDHVVRTAGLGGMLTEGRGTLQTRGAAQPAPRAVSVVCDAALYSVGVPPHPARLESGND